MTGSKDEGRRVSHDKCTLCDGSGWKTILIGWTPSLVPCTGPFVGASEGERSHMTTANEPSECGHPPGSAVCSKCRDPNHEPWPNSYSEGAYQRTAQHTEYPEGAVSVLNRGVDLPRTEETGKDRPAAPLSTANEPSVAELVEWATATKHPGCDCKACKMRPQVAAALTRLERRCAEMEKALRRLVEIDQRSRLDATIGRYLHLENDSANLERLITEVRALLPPERANEEIETP